MMNVLKYILVIQLFAAVTYAKGRKEMKTVEDVIRVLNLEPLAGEGGYFRQTYKSDYDDVPAGYFGIKSDSGRAISTAIYYLVEPNSFSVLHRLPSDEVFHFYAGDPVEMMQIDENGNVEIITLGNDIFNGQQPQVVVRRGVWQGTRLIKGGAWALLGTTVAPGFEFEDLEVADREEMIQALPQHREDIIRFTRAKSESSH